MVGLVKTNRQIVFAARPGGGGLPAMLLLAGLVSCLPGLGWANQTLPVASEVTRRMIERAETVARAERGPQYMYEKRSRLERLDAAGQPISSEQKIYQVTLIGGLPFNRLIKVEGRELTAEELRREEAREERFRQRFVSADRKKMVARKEALVTPELLDRYEFTVKERVVVSNRPTLVLTFKPRKGALPSETFKDKLLSRMAGTLWVDEADADTARVMASMVEPVSLGWLGWLGSLSRFELSLERQRMPDGAWINNKMALLIQCRKITTTLRFRTTEDSCAFTRVEPTAAPSSQAKPGD
jgi:hypothetical protein